MQTSYIPWFLAPEMVNGFKVDKKKLQAWWLSRVFHLNLLQTRANMGHTGNRGVQNLNIVFISEYV